MKPSTKQKLQSCIALRPLLHRRYRANQIAGLRIRVDETPGSQQRSKVYEASEGAERCGVDARVQGSPAPMAAKPSAGDADADGATGRFNPGQDTGALQVNTPTFPDDPTTSATIYVMMSTERRYCRLLFEQIGKS